MSDSLDDCQMIDKKSEDNLATMLFFIKENGMEPVFTDESQNELLDRLIEARLKYYVNYGIFDALTHDDMKPEEASAFRGAINMTSLFFAWVNEEENLSWRQFMNRG